MMRNQREKSTVKQQRVYKCTRVLGGRAGEKEDILSDLHPLILKLEFERDKGTFKGLSWAQDGTATSEKSFGQSFDPHRGPRLFSARRVPLPPSLVFYR